MTGAITKRGECAFRFKSSVTLSTASGLRETLVRRLHGRDTKKMITPERSGEKLDSLSSLVLNPARDHHHGSDGGK